METSLTTVGTQIGSGTLVLIPQASVFLALGVFSQGNGIIRS